MDAATPPRVRDRQTAAAAATADRQLETWIGYVLGGGVSVSAVIIFLGLVRLLLNQAQPGEPVTVAAIIAEETHATSLSAIFAGLSEGRPTSMVRLGVLVLLLTPAARVAMTVVVFLRQRDWIFVALTTLVLAILVLGLLGVLG